MKNGKFQITLKLLLWDQNFYLLLWDSYTGYGDLPGGRILTEEFYDFKNAIVREIQEELGKNLKYKINENPIFCFPHFVSKDGEYALTILFEGFFLGGEIQLSDEHHKYEWIHKKEPLEKYFSDTMLYGLEKYFYKYT